MFAQPSGRNTPKGNFSNTNCTIEPQQTEKYTTRGSHLDSLNTNDPSFFDFEPPSGTQSPYQPFSTPGASWGNDLNFRPISPPNSAALMPKDWPYSNFQQPTPSSLLTNIDPSNTRAQYGQVTPPDDENVNENLLEQYQAQQIQSQGPEKKRKRSSLNSESSPTKRSRKYTSRGAQNTEVNKPEDVKRSKFLERNRVAASKCRQKKKEWTQNLEDRAREFQKTNSSLRIVIESLRQEVLFLKSEVLKHHSCSCEEIQKFIKTGMNNDQPNDEMIFKREQSPIESMPRSRVGSVSAISQYGLDDFDHEPSVAEPTNSAIASDENALEALLSSSINHNTSDEGIASVIAT
ncbi:hypothetical protein P7C71_g1815, partial [Lecanoromycetidae sp. Uapishka_2]